jgi:aryl-alcohol dehydrogenase-like predicted oxidoreductase
VVPPWRARDRTVKAIRLSKPLRTPPLNEFPAKPPVRSLGSTGLSVSNLGFGCSAYWARPIFAEARALALVEAAIDGGITLFDTGPIYGAGLGEARLGRALRARGGAEGLVICTKVGTHVGENGRVFRDFSPEALRTSLHRSLERLRIDRVAGVHLHGPNATELTEPLLRTLEDLKAEGLVRFIGINSFDPAVVRLGLSVPLFDSFMVEYNLIRKGNAALVDEIAAAGRAAIVGSPIAQALFRPSMLPTSPKRAWELGRALLRHRADLRAARAYGFLNRLPDMTGAQAALAYVLRSPHVASAAFATTSLAHLKLNIAAAGMTLPDEQVRRIEGLPDA